tara:strand:- start:143 stop:295 length:153 start_codon:yes stop_codon:yes gene_type:complete
MEHGDKKMKRNKMMGGGMKEMQRKPMRKGGKRSLYGKGGYATAMHVQKPN